MIKTTAYYENCQIRSLVEYNNQGEEIKRIYYDEDGAIGPFSFWSKKEIL